METKLFGKWDGSDLVLNDMGIKRYIHLRNPSLIYTCARNANKRFGKARYHIVERLANKLMVTGHIKDSRTHVRISSRDSGKKQKTLNAVRNSLEIIEKRTKQNPLQILVNALKNAAPKEETTRIRQGGIIAHKAVDVAPQRRLDLALSFIAHGAGQRAFKKKTSLSSALAEELTAASNYDLKTYSISKKEELERVAGAAR